MTKVIEMNRAIEEMKALGNVVLAEVMTGIMIAYIKESGL